MAILWTLKVVPIWKITDYQIGATFDVHKMAISQWNSFIFFSKWTIFCGEFEFRLDILSSWSGPPKIGKMKCGTFRVTKWPVCSDFSPFFFSKCIIFGGESEFCQKKFGNWIGPPKNLMCMSDSYEWFLLENLLTFTRHKMACVRWIFPIFFFKVNYFCRGIQILSDRSSKLKWTPEKLNVHEWLISVIFS